MKRQTKHTPRPGTLDVITMGCSKNLVDSERLMRMFADAGFEVRHNPETPDAAQVVINTCGFIGDAKQESIDMILECLEAKKAGRIGKLSAMGCLAESYRRELPAELPAVDRWYGNFDWTDPKFALFNEPDRGYHGLRFAHDLGDLNPLAFILRLRTVGLRNQGATLSPDAAWIFLQGVESLPLRMERHSANALKVAEYLSNHPKVAWVRYPGLPSDPSYSLAQKYLPNGAGGMVVFGIKGGSAECVRLVDNIKLFSLLANVGDAKSLIIHPASTTHSQLSDEDQRKAGLQPELIRLSIGLEHIDDIIGALDDAFQFV